MITAKRRYHITAVARGPQEEPVSALGDILTMPPWHESRRSQIEGRRAPFERKTLQKPAFTEVSGV